MWISVHDRVVGPKLRNLSKEIGCSQKEALGILVSLWLWGINNADKSGELVNADKRDVADALSTGLSDGLVPMQIVESLIEVSWIDEVDGTLYLHDWDTWQEQWYKFLSRKEYDAERKRRERSRSKTPQENEVDQGRSEEADASHEDCPQENPVDEEPKKPKTKKAKPEKKKYAEFVHMQESEYQKLVTQFGQRAADKMIEVLDNYKGAKGKKYVDDYRAILNWVVKRVSEDFPGLIKPQDAPATGGNGNPFGAWREDE